MANDFDFFAETTKAAEFLIAAGVKQGTELFAAAAVLAIAKGGLLTDLTSDNVAAALPLGRSASARALRLLERHGFLVRSLRLAAGVLETNSEENTERKPFVVKNTPKNDGLEGEKCGKTPKSEDKEGEKTNSGESVSEDGENPETETPSPVPPFSPAPLPLTTPTPIPPISPFPPTPETVPTPVSLSSESSGAYASERADVAGGVAGLPPANTPSLDTSPSSDGCEKVGDDEEIPHGDALFSDYGRALLAEIDAENAAENAELAKIPSKTPSEGQITAARAEVAQVITPSENKPKKDRLTLFSNSDVAKLVTFAPSGVADVTALARVLPDLAAQGCDLAYYFCAVRDWSDSSNTRRTARGWLATLRNFYRGDLDKGRARKIIPTTVNTQDDFDSIFA